MRDNDGENGPAGTGGSAQEEGGEHAGAPPSIFAHDSELDSNDSFDAASTRAEPVFESEAVDAADSDTSPKGDAGASAGRGGRALAGGTGSNTTVARSAPGACMDQLVSAARHVDEEVAPKTVPDLGGNTGGNDKSVCEGRDGEYPTLGDASIGKVAVGDEGARQVDEWAGKDADRGCGNKDDPAVGGAMKGKADRDYEDPGARQLSGDESDSDKRGKSVIEGPSRTDVASKGGAIGSGDGNGELCWYQTKEQSIKSRSLFAVDEKLRLYSPHEVDRSPSSSYEVEEKSETCIENSKREESSDEELPPYLQFAEPKEPRVRSSSTKKEREEMIASHTNVENYVGPVPRRGYATGKSWEVVYADYCRTQRVYYRVRTSKDVDEYNRYFVVINAILIVTLLSRKHNTNTTTDQFHKFFLNYRCKHGVFQKRRGVNILSY
ncbi:hypothetical protein PInf_009976 [Phytophthora infestans]|nr:hypothetical protein PInf_009976 [Phytophthora infestans]